MTPFEEAYKRLIKYEGGYVNDPDDKGGETYKGIARHFYPKWEGWRYIDSVRNEPEFERLVEKASIVLEPLVEDFYRENFWEKVQGDKLPPIVAQEMFEQAVNLGVHTAVSHLQEALNLLNKNQKLYPDVAVDGVFGNQTLSAVDAVSKDYGNVKLLFNVLNFLQAKRYIELMQKYPKYEKYIGWFKRIELIKN